MTPAELKQLREKVDMAEKLTTRIKATDQLITLLKNMTPNVRITEKQLEIWDQEHHCHVLTITAGMRKNLLDAIDVVLRQCWCECSKLLDQISP